MLRPCLAKGFATRQLGVLSCCGRRVWTYTQTLVDALAPRGVRFTMAITGPAPSVACSRRLLSHPHLALVHRPYRLEWMPDADVDVARTGGWLLDLAERIRPDLVHVNGYAHAALPFGVPTLVVAHSCVCSWFTAVKEMAAPIEWSAHRSRVATGLGAAPTIKAPMVLAAGRLWDEAKGLSSSTTRPR